MPVPTDLYEKLLGLVRGKEYFVLTTNVDHCFQRAGFDRERLFYTQGDYGLWQCSAPCHDSTYDNEEAVREMVKSQGYGIGRDGGLTLPEGVMPEMRIDPHLIPVCPRCGRPMAMNLRSDDSFVEDAGWHRHARLYSDFMEKNGDKEILFLELGVGFNTPGIIKYPFMRMTERAPKATYACVNSRDAFTAKDIADRSIVIRGDIGDVIRELAG